MLHSRTHSTDWSGPSPENRSLSQSAGFSELPAEVVFSFLSFLLFKNVYKNKLKNRNQRKMKTVDRSFSLNQKFVLVPNNISFLIDYPIGNEIECLCLEKGSSGRIGRAAL